MKMDSLLLVVKKERKKEKKEGEKLDFIQDTYIHYIQLLACLISSTRSRARTRDSQGRASPAPLHTWHTSFHSMSIQANIPLQKSSDNLTDNLFVSPSGLCHPY